MGKNKDTRKDVFGKGNREDCCGRPPENFNTIEALTKIKDNG